MRQPTYIVTNSPWKNHLPNGTQVVVCEPRKGFEYSTWYKRVDGKLLFTTETGEEDGKFVLRSTEIEKVKIYLVRTEKLVAVASDNYPSLNIGYDIEDGKEEEMTEEEFFRLTEDDSCKFTIVKEIE